MNNLTEQANMMTSHVNKQHEDQLRSQVGRGAKRRLTTTANSHHGHHGDTAAHYDELIGAIDQGTSSTRFLAFERGTGRLVASSQLEIKRLTPREGWVEIDPNAIMSSVYATMANVHDQLLAKQHQLTSKQPGNLLKCIGICNQRESAVVWDSKTGRPLYNVIVWMDNRTKDIVDDMIDSIPGRDFNRLKDKTGLPMSTYFSAFKLKWLIDNVPEVRQALDERRLLVGTVDSWILWNLTGQHLTDVTNASRTFLMDIETLQWDKSLCKQFRVPMEILPKILSSADDFGRLQFGPFLGTPITGVIGDQSAALFGHNCLQPGQTKATFGTGCFIMQNIGPGPLNGALSGVQREAKRGLITTVGFKLKDKPACYALEGSIKIAGAALTWLRDNLQLIENYEECDQLVNMATHSAGVFFVPALGGLYSPYWDPNAAGLYIGLSQFSRREHLVRATFDSVAFQTNDILSLMRGVTNGLMIDGGLCKSDNLCQILADITGCDIVRPSMCETSALGAAMVAGCGAGIWDYDAMMAHSNTPYEYSSSANQTHHYPHESLHYDDNKFSSLIQSNNRTFKSQQVHSKHQRPNQQQELLQRRSSRHRSGGYLMRNLDAGGGINDDAGGGGAGEGGGGGGDREHNPSQLRRASSPTDGYQTTTDEDEDRVSSSGQLASCSETDYDAGIAVSSSGEFTGASSECNDPIEAPIHQLMHPQAHTTLSAVAENPNSAGSGAESSSMFEEATEQEDQLPVNGHHHHHHHHHLNQPQQQQQQQQLCGRGAQSSPATGFGNKALRRPMTGASLLQLNQHHVNHVAPSSGYSSGDNFESATTNSVAGSCQLLTDSTRCCLVDSPTSQATDLMSLVSTNGGGGGVTEDGRDSVATCTHLTPAPATTQRGNNNSTSPQTAISKGQDSFPYAYHSANTITAQRTNANGVGPVVQERQDKFVANAEDVADEVHEFGGRDSYGEDGYDSSTVSFDSYEDDDDDVEENVDDADQEVARLNGVIGGKDVEAADNGANCEEKLHQSTGGEIDQSETTTMTTTATSALVRGANKEVSSTTAASVDNHHHHRRRQASLLEKQMDVFQPYISLEHRTDLVGTWRLAVGRSMQWTKVHHEEVRRIDYQRLSSLPISMYVFFSIGMVALSGFLSSSSAPIIPA